jgi:steroid 5-alpha reductase family enzyme
VTVWGLRLSIHILRRNAGKPEDFRYQAWRRQHGARWWWLSFFQVFVLQGVLMWIISSTLLIGMSGAAPVPLGWLDAVALLVFAIGFLFEAAGDWQLAQFKADPANKGKVMDRGLWRYTRHPNYFGDATIWWAFGLIAVGASNGIFALIGPAIMTLLLTRVSGVSLLEQSMNRRAGYREYVERTSSFFPLPPKR